MMGYSNNQEQENQQDYLGRMAGNGELQEDAADYGIGGYHAVKVLDFYDDRYLIIRKFGWGAFSTTWLSWDFEGKRFVAIKILKGHKRFAQIARSEIAMLVEVVKKDPFDKLNNNTIQLLNKFVINGQNGTHTCLVFEVLGYSLSRLILQSDEWGIPRDNVRNITRQMLQGLNFLHNVCQIIHTDLKPNNILMCVDDEDTLSLVNEIVFALYNNLKLPKSSVACVNYDEESMVLSEMEKKKLKMLENDLMTYIKLPKKHVKDAISIDCRRPPPATEICPANLMNVKLADLGNACLVHRHIYSIIQSELYRSPEVIIDSGYNTTADIWSAACVIYELITGDSLFDFSDVTDEMLPQEHLRQMTQLLGEIPSTIALSGNNSNQYFDTDGKMLRVDKLQQHSLQDIMIQKHGWSEFEAGEFSSFIIPMLHYDINTRSSALDCLKHQWLIPPSERPAICSPGMRHQQYFAELNENDAITESAEQKPANRQ